MLKSFSIAVRVFGAETTTENGKKVLSTEGPPAFYSLLQQPGPQNFKLFKIELI